MLFETQQYLYFTQWSLPIKAHKVVSKITHLVFVYVTEDQTEIEKNNQKTLLRL